MSVFAQTAQGDLDLTTKNLVVLQDVARAAAQTLFNRFRSFRGEWFLDTRRGVPYFQSVFVKNPDLGVIRQIFRRVITTTPGVLSVLSMDLALDSARRLTFSFRAKVDTGQVISGGLGVPFIVEG